MKIKRFFAPTMRDAIQQVRQEQGPDAVILSNRRVAGGIEIIAAVDYDESLLHNGTPKAEAPAAPVADEKPADAVVAQLKPDTVSVSAKIPAAEPRRVETPAPAAAAPRRQADAAAQVEWSQEPTLVEMRREMKNLRGLLEGQLSGLAWNVLNRNEPGRAGLLQRLLGLGLSGEIARHLAEAVPVNDDLDYNWRQALAQLAGAVPVTNDDILSQGGVVALVGPTGVGKTTTVAKLAARFALRHGRRHVALVTTDSYRIGAHEQLRTYGRILGVPVHTAANAEELRAVMLELRDKKLVLIDTAGMSQRDVRLSEQFATLRGGGAAVRSYLVLSATTQGMGLDEAVRAFRKVELAGCILTKVDEATSLGGALSVAIQRRLPVAYIGDGQRVPEDMHPARAHNLVNRSVIMSQESAQAAAEEGMTMSFGEPAYAAVAAHG